MNNILRDFYESNEVKKETKIVKRTNDPYINRAINALLRFGFKTWEEVNSSKIEDLLEIRGMSKKGLILVIKEMNDLGI